MSRIFKAPRVNVGEPFEVTISEEEINHHNRTFNMVRSSDLRGLEPNDAASAIITDATNQANDIVDQANQEANQITENANQEAEQIRSQAQQQGYNDGYAKGLQDGKMETEDLANQALMIKEEVEIERASLTRTIEAQVVDLILQAVKKIVGNELVTRENVILDVVVKALNKIGSGENVNVKVSQEDFEVLNDNKIKVASKCDNTFKFDVTKDLTLQKGDCIIETECGTVDAGVNTQLDKFEDTISETMGFDTDAK